MKIRMKTIAAGPGGNRDAGKVYDVEEKEAQELIDGGYAEDVKEEESRAEEPESEELETATAKGDENAAAGKRAKKAPARKK